MQALDFRPIPPFGRRRVSPPSNDRGATIGSPHVARGAASRACEIPRSPRESAVDVPRGASGDRMRRDRAPQGRSLMKRIAFALAVATILSSPAFAAKIGVSMDKFDDNFLTVLRNGMSDYAKTQPGVTLQIEDAKDDVSKQLSQVQNFIANKVDAIIVNPVDTSATAAITKAAAEAGVPLVYVNREPDDVERSARRPRSSRQTKRLRHARDQTNLQAARRQGRILVIEGELSTRPQCSAPRTFTKSSRPRRAAA